ncbi:MAG TPA: glycine dehydrogenase (aminomethyl-transferring), partial [Mangrovimonas sp.]|nr:glycine dehydrogenase (aminomethyl-transferring) [Mangrovimonas sp.]
AVRERDQKKDNVHKFFVSENVLPQTLSLLETRANPLGIKLIVGDENNFEFTQDFFGALLQYPGKDGQICDIKTFIKKANASQIKVAVAADILSLVLLEAPGKFGADVVLGSTQRFGIPMGFGGPHAGYFATKDAYKRDIPGRIIGVTKDASGNRALRMALQTREQHIKRDKATSNICTAQVLLAVMAGMYAVYHGPKGLKFIAENTHKQAVLLSDSLEKLGFKQVNTNYFDTLQIKTNAKKVKKVAKNKKVNFYYPDEDTVTISLNETTSIRDINYLISIFAEVANKKAFQVTEMPSTTAISEALQRTTEFLTLDVFNSYHSETKLMRYIKKLERKDLSLNHSMISLGSCTMKLNAAAEMLPLSWFKWGKVHPFAPAKQAQGYLTVLKDLETMLSEITGFAATSLQPNSGAQGEYAGLMVIREYHKSRGEG